MHYLVGTNSIQRNDTAIGVSFDCRCMHAGRLTYYGGRPCWDCWTNWRQRIQRIELLPLRHAFYPLALLAETMLLFCEQLHMHDSCNDAQTACRADLMLHTYLQTFGEWASTYVKYVQLFKKLERAYDQAVHPQKRKDMKGALEACMGRVLEVKAWLVCQMCCSVCHVFRNR